MTFGIVLCVKSKMDVRWLYWLSLLVFKVTHTT